MQISKHNSFVRISTSANHWHDYHGIELKVLKEITWRTRGVIWDLSVTRTRACDQDVYFGLLNYRRKTVVWMIWRWWFRRCRESQPRKTLNTSSSHSWALICVINDGSLSVFITDDINNQSIYRKSLRSLYRLFLLYGFLNLYDWCNLPFFIFS